MHRFRQNRPANSILCGRDGRLLKSWVMVIVLSVLATSSFAKPTSLSAIAQSSVAIATPSLMIRKDLPEEEKPFWQKKPELLHRIREERAVLVSVGHETIAGDQIRFTISGAGLVHRAKDECFAIAQRYDRLKEISDHFKTVSFDPLGRELFVVTEALGYQARMVMRMLPVDEKWRSELQWEVIWGHFKGMTGLIGFEPTDANHTEMSLSARYQASELPLPRALMGFALEVITQKVAERMRAFIEEQPAQALLVEADPKSKDDAKLKTSPPDRFDLASIHLPPGFVISVFARDVKGARQMVLSPNGTLFVGTRDVGKVYAIEGAAKALADRRSAPPIQTIASGLNEPNGVAFHDGSLYVAEIPRILRFDDIEKNLAAPKAPIVVRNDFPKDTHHGWKYIAIGPDGWLYVPVGAPCNVCKSTNPIYASITRMTLDGKKREIYAQGVRNTVGFAWHPKTKELWFTDNGRDLLGDDLPADELNHAEKAGLHFGFPFCHQGDIRDPEFGKGVDCGPKGRFRAPVQKLDPHAAALGMKFYQGEQFPETYRGRIFIAEHGSWNRSKKIGYRISTVRLDSAGRALNYEAFADGWLHGETSAGRPVDLVVTADGSLLISDDLNGVIYQVRYQAASEAVPRAAEPSPSPSPRTSEGP